MSPNIPHCDPSPKGEKTDYARTSMGGVEAREGEGTNTHPSSNSKDSTCERHNIVTIKNVRACEKVVSEGSSTNQCGGVCTHTGWVVLRSRNESRSALCESCGHFSKRSVASRVEARYWPVHLSEAAKYIIAASVAFWLFQLVAHVKTHRISRSCGSRYNGGSEHRETY